MAQPSFYSYSVDAGQPINGGRWAGGKLTGNGLFQDIECIGTLDIQHSTISGNTTLDPILPAGGLTDGMPLWWRSAPVGQWVAISGTAGPAAGLNTNSFSDLTIRTSDSTLIAVASGGHNDGASNAAASIRLIDDTPTWATLKASTWNGTDVNVLYYSDGTPCSRHTYHHTHYIESLNAVLLAGCRFGYGGGTPTGPGLDLFDLSTNNYLPRYTWPDMAGYPATGYGIVQDGSGNIWTQGGYKIDANTGVTSKPGTGALLRYPAAYDSIRDRIFAMQYDDGEGYATVGFQAVELNPATGNSQNITFNASSAYSAFLAAAPAYSAMTYCTLDGKFYFMNAAAPQTFYVVTPNAGTTWDMATLAVGGSTLTAPGVLCKRFFWVPGLSGFVVQVNQSSNLYFLRSV